MTDLCGIEVFYQKKYNTMFLYCSFIDDEEWFFLDYELRRGFFNSTFSRFEPTLNPSILDIARRKQMMNQIDQLILA